MKLKLKVLVPVLVISLTLFVVGGFYTFQWLQRARALEEQNRLIDSFTQTNTNSTSQDKVEVLEKLQTQWDKISINERQKESEAKLENVKRYLKSEIRSDFEISFSKFEIQNIETISDVNQISEAISNIQSLLQTVENASNRIKDPSLTASFNPKYSALIETYKKRIAQLKAEETRKAEIAAEEKRKAEENKHLRYETEHFVVEFAEHMSNWEIMNEFGPNDSNTELSVTFFWGQRGIPLNKFENGVGMIRLVPIGTKPNVIMKAPVYIGDTSTGYSLYVQDLDGYGVFENSAPNKSPAKIFLK